MERAVTRPSVSSVRLPETANSTEEMSPSPAGFASAAVASSAMAVNAPPMASDLPPGFVRLKLTFERSAESVWARADEGDEGAEAEAAAPRSGTVVSSSCVSPRQKVGERAGRLEGLGK